MDDKLKSVLEKVAKLRALAAGAGTQAEAEAAAAQAAALIAKYQIAESEVETFSRPEEMAEGDNLWSSTGRNERWRSLLACGLGEDYGCAVVYSTSDSGVVYRIVGRPSDVEIVRYMFAWLSAEILRLADRERGLAARNGFRLGAVAGVLRAMRRTRGEEMRTAPNGSTTALAITGRAEDAFRVFTSISGQKVTVGRGAQFSDRNAVRRGLEAGASLAPRPGLAAGEGRFMLGTGR